jgi:hypothetical protein
MGYDDAIFVRGALGFGEQSPVGNQLFSLVQSKDNIGIADVDGEQHVSICALK